MQRLRLSDRLQEVVAHENWKQGVFSEKKSWQISFGENLLHVISKLRIRIVPCFYKKFLLYSERHSTNSKQSPHNASGGHWQEVKTMENTLSRWLTRGGCLREVRFVGIGLGKFGGFRYLLAYWRSKRFCSVAVLCISFTWQMVKTRMIRLWGVQGWDTCDQIAIDAFQSN